MATFKQRKALGRGMAKRMLVGGTSLLGKLLTDNELGNTDYVQPVLTGNEANLLRDALDILRKITRSFDKNSAVVREHYLKGEEHWKTVRNGTKTF